jgi:N-acetylmuramic acid 6-phosphate etherase
MDAQERGLDATLSSTEAVDAASRGLDTLAIEELVALLAREQRRAVEAVALATPAIARAVEAIVERLRAGGKLHYVGAGTSGRLAALDAAECPPTFGTPPSLVSAHVAGGPAALVRAVEGAEDDAAAGEAQARAAFAPTDAVVGISASGGARYVVAALRAARALGALTIGVTNDERSALAAGVELPIVVATGAEPLAGSTRLVAGTAQKLVLNALSTATMVRLGKVYDNLMVDVVAGNEKLRRRALRLVALLAPADEARARTLLEAAEGSVKVAVVMARRDVDAAAARELLAQADGFLRRLL